MGKQDTKLIHFKDLAFVSHGSFVDRFTPDPVTPTRPTTAADLLSSNGNDLGLRKHSTATRSSDSLRAVPGALDSSSPNLGRKTRRVVKALFTFCNPEAQIEPTLVITSETASKAIGVDASSLKSSSALELLAGNTVHPNAAPYAQNYGGHQFGIYAGQLGDGRSVTLGEVIGSSTTSRWELQLKGSGPTCYARGGDGLFTLSGAIWEYIMTEYLSQLGVPTSQSISVVATKSPVCRGINVEAGAVLCRIAPSWIRFGTFELLHYREEKEQLKQLADYVIEAFYPQSIDEEYQQELKTRTLVKNPEAVPVNGKESTLAASPSESSNMQTVIPLNRYAIFYRMVVKKTAHMVAHWQANGFVHGALSTDNMSILGLTMHLGSAAFLDQYDPEYTANPKDFDQQYRFDNQPMSAQWNLSRLGRTLVELVGRERIPVASQSNSKHSSVAFNPKPVLRPLQDVKSDLSSSKFSKSIPSLPSQKTYKLGFLFDAAVGENIIREITNEFEGYFIEEFMHIMSLKLGLLQKKENDIDRIIIPLLDLMANVGVDYTYFFRLLCNFRCAEPHFSQSIQYDPDTKHSRDTLMNKAQCSTPLELLLKTLFVRQKEEDSFIAAQEVRNSLKVLEKHNPSTSSLPRIDQIPDSPLPLSVKKGSSRDNLKTSGPSKSKDNLLSVNMPTLNAKEKNAGNNVNSKANTGKGKALQEELIRLPSANEVATLWKYWSQMYRARLTQELPAEKKSNAAGLESEDQLRSARMKRINPSHVPRTYVVKELIEKIGTQYVPTQTQNGFASRKLDNKRVGEPVIQEESEESGEENQGIQLVDGENAEMVDFIRVLIRDMWGGIGDSKGGWESEHQAEIAKKLGLEPSLVRLPSN